MMKIMMKDLILLAKEDCDLLFINFIEIIIIKKLFTNFNLLL